MDILTRIIDRRKSRIAEQGHALGNAVPDKRKSPLIPFIRDPFLICEVKRKSPSKGIIAEGLDAVRQAEIYHKAGVRSVSVLTEEDHFGGSLSDLMAVKSAFPDLALLRKDFLFSPEDIDVSFRAGADAVLLIASVLDQDTLAALHGRALSLGMEALVEVHSPLDVRKARELSPALTGINARDLARFTVDLTLPLSLSRQIDWETSLVFESGIHAEEDARVALGAGFRGLLVGEAVVRRPQLAGELRAAFSGRKASFWGRLYSRRPPFVKVCGLTRRKDVLHASECGADILGFIFAPSKRKTDAAFLESLADINTLKAAVVVTDGSSMDTSVQDLLEKGLVDVIQFHGDEKPEECFRQGFPYYKALQVKDHEDITRMSMFKSPRVLADAWSEGERGGTGKRLTEEIVNAIREHNPLWLAGGLGADNIGMVLDRFSPELVDASSRLESAPGVKDHRLVEAFVKAVVERKG